MYREDKSYLLASLRRSGLAGIDVNTEDTVQTSSVNAYQGKQKKVIILHFVAAFDRPDPFGFVSHANRLCVATTRAEEYLFMFGNRTQWMSKIEERGSHLRTNRTDWKGDYKSH